MRITRNAGLVWLIRLLMVRLIWLLLVWLTWLMLVWLIRLCVGRLRHGGLYSGLSGLDFPRCRRKLPGTRRWGRSR